MMIGDEWIELVSLWARCRGSDMAPPLMPESGGVGEQAAWLMDAFAMLDRLYRGLS